MVKQSGRYLHPQICFAQIIFFRWTIIYLKIAVVDELSGLSSGIESFKLKCRYTDFRLEMSTSYLVLVICIFFINSEVWFENKDLKQTTTALSTRTWPNKRFNERTSCSTRAFYNSVHFLAILCKTTTLIRQILLGRRKGTIHVSIWK